MEEKNQFGKILGPLILISLMILSIFIIRPIALSIFIALLLSFLLSPVYNWVYGKIKRKTLSVLLIIFALLTIIILPIWFFTPLLIRQSFEIFQMILKIDFVEVFKIISPKLFASETFAIEVGSIFSSFAARLGNQVVNSLANIVFNAPTLLLHLLVILFTFFFVLKEKESLVAYIKGVLPFSKEVIEKLFNYSSGITKSLLYGQILVGLIQGLILGIGLFLFGIPNALFLTLISMFAGILPIIGPFIVWVPLSIYLLVTQGSSISFWGILIFGLFASTIDNYLRPMIISRTTKIHPAVIFISMVGGMFFFGVFGLLLGPLIISYMLIFLEIYRGRNISLQIIQKKSKETR